MALEELSESKRVAVNKATPQFDDLDEKMKVMARDYFIGAIAEIESRVEKGELTKDRALLEIQTLRLAADQNTFISNMGINLASRQRGMLTDKVSHEGLNMPPLVVGIPERKSDDRTNRRVVAGTIPLRGENP